MGTNTEQPNGESSTVPLDETLVHGNKDNEIKLTKSESDSSVSSLLNSFYTALDKASKFSLPGEDEDQQDQLDPAEIKQMEQEQKQNTDEDDDDDDDDDNDVDGGD